MSQNINSDKVFEEKYLKYKNKYLQLKREENNLAFEQDGGIALSTKNYFFALNIVDDKSNSPQRNNYKHKLRIEYDKKKKNANEYNDYTSSTLMLIEILSRCLLQNSVYKINHTTLEGSTIEKNINIESIKKKYNPKEIKYTGNLKNGSIDYDKIETSNLEELQKYIKDDINVKIKGQIYIAITVQRNALSFSLKSFVAKLKMKDNINYHVTKSGLLEEMNISDFTEQLDINNNNKMDQIKDRIKENNEQITELEIKKKNELVKIEKKSVIDKKKIEDIYRLNIEKIKNINEELRAKL
jgi:Spy/CpxP family protein refolding chaperone